MRKNLIDEVPDNGIGDPNVESNEDIREESNELIKQAYLSLRGEKLIKEQIQELEEYLSTHIYKTEELIQEAKKNTTQNLIEEYYRRRSVLKRIADGLAWTIFDNNSNILDASSIGYAPGFMAGKKGYAFERNTVRALYKLPNIRFAIQCDITNILRLCDIIAVKDNGQLIPIEIKGSRSGSSHRQKKRAIQIIEYSRTGILENAIKGFAPLHSVKVPVLFEYYWEELEILCERAIKDGIAWKMFDNSLVIEVINPQVSNNQVVDQIVMEMVKQLDWGDSKITISSLGRHLSKDADVLPRTRLPITIFQISPFLGLEFLLGRLDAIILLNKSNVLNFLNKKGLESILNADGSATMRTKGGKTFSILNAWDKLLNEMITVPSFIDYICASADSFDVELKAEQL
jgi:hypothetical protein